MTKPTTRRRKAESPGERLRREVLAAYELNPAEMLLLGEAAALADALERINAEVAASPLTTAGSKGQEVASPLLHVQREHGARLAALLSAIALPDRDQDAGRSSTSKSAQRAALVRWSREREAG